MKKIIVVVLILFAVLTIIFSNHNDVSADFCDIPYDGPIPPKQCPTP